MRIELYRMTEGSFDMSVCCTHVLQFLTDDLVEQVVCQPYVQA